MLFRYLCSLEGICVLGRWCIQCIGKCDQRHWIDRHEHTNTILNTTSRIQQTTISHGECTLKYPWLVNHLLAPWYPAGTRSNLCHLVYWEVRSSACQVEKNRSEKFWKRDIDIVGGSSLAPGEIFRGKYEAGTGKSMKIHLLVNGCVWKCWVYSQWNSHLIGIMIINHWV